MQTLSANEAKTQFGEMLMKVQGAPVQINKNGKPVAVVLSMEEFAILEELKQELLQARVARARSAVSNGKTVDGAEFFEELSAGKHA